MMKTLKKLVSLIVALSMLMTSCAFADASALTPGTYTGEGAGNNGKMKVEVTLDEAGITDIKIVEHVETAGICDPAFATLPQMMIEHQSLNVDAVAGATNSSKGLIEAVTAALVSAGVDVSAMQTPVVAADEETTSTELVDYDIVVVGAGFAGITAAVRAAELGGKVLLLEQSNVLGGSALYAGGYMAGAGTKMQAENGIEDSGDNFYADIINIIGGKEPEFKDLVYSYTHESGAAVDWLDEVIGVGFDRTVNFGAAFYAKQNVARVYGGTGGMMYMTPMIERLNETIEAGQVSLLKNTTVTELLTDETGAVSGVVAVDAKGNKTEYPAGATILATGGYGYNEQWLKRYNFTNVTSSALPTATGSGYELMEKVGGVFSMMDVCDGYAGSVPVSGFDCTTTVSTHYPGAIWVYNDGKRFTNEWDIDTNVIAKYWDNAPENEVFILLGENMLDRTQQILSGNVLSAMSVEEGWANFDKYVAEGNMIYKADTIAELAQKMGVDATALEETINTYNGYAENGTDEAFGRSEVTKLESPYYAIYTVPYVLLTNGGVAVNAQGQPYNADGEIIEGVYCAGEITGSLHYTGGSTVAGTCLTMCVTYGRITAEEALKRVGVLTK